jgi:hypothetical protein
MSRYPPGKVAFLHLVSPDPLEPTQSTVSASTYDGGDQQIRSASSAQELDSHLLSSGEAEVSTTAQDHLHDDAIIYSYFTFLFFLLIFSFLFLPLA